MELCTRSKGTLATKSRWFSRFDAAKLLAQRRHYLMFLVDTALIMQRHNPYTHHINFADSLQEVFDREKQSMKAASSILHDANLFEANVIHRTLCNR